MTSNAPPVLISLGGTTLQLVQIKASAHQPPQAALSIDPQRLLTDTRNRVWSLYAH